MDCIHYKVREDGRILSRAAYIVLGITADGYKDILSITVGANETSKFWLGMLNDLKNRGVQDVLFFCVDGLPGFKEAIGAVYPDAQIQRCVIHMLRNSFKYVNYSDLKKFSSDFKAVYNAPNETSALSELEKIKEKWTQRYRNWDQVLNQLIVLYEERLTLCGVLILLYRLLFGFSLSFIVHIVYPVLYRGFPHPAFVWIFFIRLFGFSPISISSILRRFSSVL